MTLVLGIESTCDETACALVKDGKELLSNCVASQADLHALFGGVVPELACRRHIDVLLPLIDQTLKEAGCSLEDIDAIAVAQGPGLLGAILIGLNAAKTLALTLGKPLFGVNHVEAHLYASALEQDLPPFPYLGVVLSGGHTALWYMESWHDYRVLATTIDDAIGEAFDKVASLLELPYPGGPHIERLAKQGDPLYYTLKAGKVKEHELAFSLSGLKTKVLYTAKGQNSSKKSPLIISEQEKAHLAAAFQEAALGDVLDKVKRVLLENPVHALLMGGGVTQNQRLREIFEAAMLPAPLYWPSRALCLDNAAMIAGLGYQHFCHNPQGDPLSIQPFTTSRQRDKQQAHLCS